MVTALTSSIHQDGLHNRSTTFTPCIDGANRSLTSQSGVEPQTETVWRQATEMVAPRITKNKNG